MFTIRNLNQKDSSWSGITDFPVKKKFKMLWSVKKIMLTDFWEIERIYHYWFSQNWCHCKKCLLLSTPGGDIHLIYWMALVYELEWAHVHCTCFFFSTAEWKRIFFCKFWFYIGKNIYEDFSNVTTDLWSLFLEMYTMSLVVPVCQIGKNIYWNVSW